MYPIHFKPIYQDYVWGGDRIARVYHREIDLPRVAESWEISDRDDGMSVVMNGALKGKTLHELVLEMGPELLGLGQTFSRFPILTKIIDAKENLSIQVHRSPCCSWRCIGTHRTRNSASLLTIALESTPLSLASRCNGGHWPGSGPLRLFTVRTGH